MRLLLCNFTTLSKVQKQMILAWRNHEEVRAYMYNENAISEAEHFSFIESLKTRKDRRYFLVQHEGVDIGVIDFNDISNESAVMGLYANPTLHQKGVGSLLMDAIVAYAFKTLNVHTLKAEVFESNTKAKTLYEKFGFCEKGRKMVNEKEVICMELSHEHRSF
ncbi:UDP-4-amino-4,6-dideoxy-N-acetyl-beta-L-altrosamine N-acetyltransferase [Sulfurospirillum cavolei]|uniref:UDP-4-amino-4, 6-dideoxy-N-acetyl-beta-L-altrosamine N-acetyltransferase n=1 Tax=Sulfurospirillum cavolei TaxID=366522 RepID=UPI000764CBD4|nr:UDP-4-amino-4,6-dideoxy-N-acetyl-beta-L-altrosamine N-acetyltransferase [Sulfurospirillum cavolei]